MGVQTQFKEAIITLNAQRLQDWSHIGPKTEAQLVGVLGQNNPVAKFATILSRIAEHVQWSSSDFEVSRTRRMWPWNTTVCQCIHRLSMPGGVVVVDDIQGSHAQLG